MQTELDLGWSDFGVRCFDNWKARWEGIDIMSEVTPQASPYAYTLGNPIRFSDPTGMLTEDEDGMIMTSTSLWGRDATGGENTGEVLNSKFLSEGQIARDVITYTANGGGDPINGGSLPTVTVTPEGNGGFYDQTPVRYGFGGSLSEWQAAYGCEGCSYESTYNYWSALNGDGNFEAEVAFNDQLEKMRADVERMKFWMGTVFPEMASVLSPSGGTGGGGVRAAGLTPRGFSLRFPRGVAGNTGIHQVSTSDLHATHGQTLSKREFKRVMSDIRQNGFNDPLIYVTHNGKKFLVDGNHRILMARRLGIKQVPAMEAKLPYGSYRTPADLVWTRY